VFSAEALVCASLEQVEKGGTNMGLGKAAESHESMGLGAALDGGYAARTSADGFVQL